MDIRRNRAGRYFVRSGRNRRRNVFNVRRMGRHRFTGHFGNMPAAEKTSLKRHIGSSSVKVELDSAKRIAIPAEMAGAVGIGNEAVFAGMLDYFEIWGPDRYADMHSQEKRVVASALKSLE